MLPRDLEDDANFGRQHIQTLLSMVMHAHGHDTFVRLARPFLLVITHSALLDCLSVDTAVGGLYNFISGSNGSRAVTFFQRLNTSLLQDYLETTTSSSATILETTLLAMLTALYEIFKRERRATFNDGLSDLFSSIENIIEVSGEEKHSATIHVVQNRLREFRGIVSRARGLLRHEEEPDLDGVSTAVVTSAYPRDIVLPQDRHDNDKMDITKIKILPAEEEIRSNLPEFIPSTDPNQPHFLIDQVERHLDTHFRLLRHDVFGELSEALGGLMVALEDQPALIENPKLCLGNIRAYPTPKAHISYVSFDQRQGLEAQISFPHPYALRKKSQAEKPSWWEESKRLEEGTLLCFVSSDDTKSSLLFFTVSEKCTDVKKSYNLISDNHHATITAKLAGQSQSDMESMIHLSCQTTHGLLIEFPGVLLATFVPVLENIQDMQRLHRLPFRPWILPSHAPSKGDASKQLEMPPPVYARHPCFFFPLNPILKDIGDNLSISSKTSVDSSRIIDQLEARTLLDRGQCQALIAALTREYALIQGPPGTGKSFLGVQLMRVLLACKIKAELGPVVVV